MNFRAVARAINSDVATQRRIARDVRSHADELAALAREFRNIDVATIAGRLHAHAAEIDANSRWTADGLQRVLIEVADGR